MDCPITQIRINPRRPFAIKFEGRSSQGTPSEGSRSTSWNDPFSLQTRQLMPRVLDAWGAIGCEITFVVDGLLEKRIDDLADSLLRQAADRTKAILDLVEQEGFGIDGDRIRGILVEHLSPIDRGSIQYLVNMNLCLKEGLAAERKRWYALINSAKCLSAPALSTQLLESIEKEGMQALTEIDRYVVACKAAEKVLAKGKAQFRNKRSMGVRKIIAAMPKVLMESGLSRSHASTLTHRLIGAWDQEVDPSTPSSIRVRTLQDHPRSESPKTSPRL